MKSLGIVSLFTTTKKKVIKEGRNMNKNKISLPIQYQGIYFSNSTKKEMLASFSFLFFTNTRTFICEFHSEGKFKTVTKIDIIKVACHVYVCFVELFYIISLLA